MFRPIMWSYTLDTKTSSLEITAEYTYMPQVETCRQTFMQYITISYVNGINTRFVVN